MLVVEAVEKTYLEGDRRHAVLKGASLTVNEGEIVAIVGKSGSGKSTLLNAIAGTDLPDSGSIRLDGSDLSSMDPDGAARWRREHVGFVFQFFHLLPYLTGLENAALPLRMLGRWNDRSRADVEAMIARLGLEACKDRLPERMSGGERQRFAIVRAIAHAPRLILADEPTGNLDEANTASVSGQLFDLIRERRSMAVVVTHAESVAKRADRVLHMKDGTLC